MALVLVLPTGNGNDVRSLDQYQRYIKEREQTADNGNGSENPVVFGAPGAAASPSKETKKAHTKSASAVSSEASAEPSVKTRYVLRGGVTVPVADAQSGVLTKGSEVPVETAPSRKPAPKAVTLPEPELLPGDAPDDETPANTPASLWERLPRHIQLLAQIPAPLEEEVAQKYYTRGFRESREELIERLLDPPLTLEETARVLGVCPATVRRYTNRGVLLHQRTVGQQRRFRLSDVLLFLEKQQTKSAGATARPKK